MLVILTTSFHLLGMCLALYTSTAFASPVAINFTPKPLGGLVRRRPATDTILCKPASGWVQRQCVPERGYSVWQDVCRTPANIITTGLSGCLPGFRCQNEFDSDGDRSIICIPIFQPGKAQARVKEDDPQIGASEMKTATNSLTKFQFDVRIVGNLGLSSVAAALMSKFLPQMLNV